MTRRFVVSITLLVAIISIALALPLGIAINNNQKDEFIKSLELSTVSTSAIMSSQPYIDWSNTAAITATETGARVVVVDSNLNLIIDSELSPLNRPFIRPELTEALAGKLSSSIRYSSTLTTDLRYVAAPITQGFQVVGVVRLSLPENTVDSAVFRSQLWLFAFVVLVITVAAALSWLIGRSIAKPVDDLTKVIEDAAIDLSRKANEFVGPVEVKRAAVALNKTTTRLDDLLKRTERVAEEASHHLRSPLTSVRLRLETILETSNDTETVKNAEAALNEVDRLSTRISQVLALTKADSGAKNIIIEPLAEIVRNQVQLVEPLLSSKDLKIDLDLQECDVRVPIGISSQIVNELISNAINYAKTKVKVSLLIESNMAKLTVSDDGIGLPVGTHPEQIFDRFFRAENAMPGGSGLGLALVKESAISAGGNAWVDKSEMSPGLTISVTLPIEKSIEIVEEK